MEKNQPNCKKCKWSSIINFGFMILSNCLAQGSVHTSSVYNNKICKKLYEENINIVEGEKDE